MTEEDHLAIKRVADTVVHNIELDRKRANFWRSTWMWATACLISLALTIGMFGLFASNHTISDSLRGRDTLDATTRARTECRNAYTVRVTETKGDFDIAFADALLIGISQPTPEALQAAKDALQNARDTYLAATADRVNYDRTGAILPCPITPYVPVLEPGRTEG